VIFRSSGILIGDLRDLPLKMNGFRGFQAK